MMRQVEGGLAADGRVGRKRASDRSPHVPGESRQVVRWLDQSKPEGQPGHRGVHRDYRMGRGKEQDARRAGLTEVREVAHGKPGRSKRTVQAMVEGSLPPEHIRTGFER